MGDTEDDENLAKKINREFLAVTDGLRDEKYLNGDYRIASLNELKEGVFDEKDTAVV